MKAKSRFAMSGALWTVVLLMIVFAVLGSPISDFLGPLLTVAYYFSLIMLVDAAFLALTGVWFHQAIGQTIVFLGLVIYRAVLKAVDMAQGSKRLEEFQARLAEPAPIAKRSIDVLGIHPRLMRDRAVVLLGYNSRARPIMIDLADANTLVAASTRGGKTNALASFIIQLCSKPNPPEIHVLDLKANPNEPLYHFKPLVHCVHEPEDALNFLRRMVTLMNERQRTGKLDPPVIVIADEVADLTSDTTDKAVRREAEVLFTMLARKSLSGGVSLILATQHPRFDVLKKAIAHNLMRKIMFPVDTRGQAEVVIGYKPEARLPVTPGEFLLRDGIGLKRGKTLKVEVSEIQELVTARFASFDDPRLKLWRELACGKQVGDLTEGINAMHLRLRESADWASQNFIRYGKRNLAHAGVLEVSGSGKGYRVAMDFVEGVPIVQRFIDAGNWQEEPT